MRWLMRSNVMKASICVNPNQDLAKVVFKNLSKLLDTYVLMLFVSIMTSQQMLLAPNFPMLRREHFTTNSDFYLIKFVTSFAGKVHELNISEEHIFRL